MFKVFSFVLLFIGFGLFVWYLQAVESLIRVMKGESDLWERLGKPENIADIGPGRSWILLQILFKGEVGSLEVEEARKIARGRFILAVVYLVFSVLALIVWGIWQGLRG